MTLIRATYNGRIASMQRRTARSAERLARVQKEAVTGLRVSRPSDDPGRTPRIHSIKETRADQEVYKDNAAWAEGILERADGALQEMSIHLSRARELAVQMSSEEYTVNQRTQAATTAQGLFDSFIETANAQFGDRYIFAGNAYDQPAYTAAGVYQGDTGQPEVPVSEGLDAATGFDGSDLLQGTGDMVAAFANLVTNLGSGLAGNVQTSLDDLDAALDQLTEAQVTVGSEMNIAMDATDLATSLGIEMAAIESDLTEVDTAESYTRLYQFQQAYEAALAVTASSRSSLLFDRI